MHIPTEAKYILAFFFVAFVVHTISTHFHPSIGAEHVMMGPTTYVLAKYDDRYEASELLAEARNRISHLLFRTGHPAALLRWNKAVFIEKSQSRSSPMAVNWGKGRLIEVCLRDCSGRLGDVDVITYLLLHEATHIVLPSYLPTTTKGYTVHDEEFMKREREFLQLAISMNLINRSDLSSSTHCCQNLGAIISSQLHG